MNFEENIKKCQISLEEMNSTLEIMMQQSHKNLKEIEKLISQNAQNAENTQNEHKYDYKYDYEYDKIFLEMTKNNLIIEEEILKLKISIAKNSK